MARPAKPVPQRKCLQCGGMFPFKRYGAGQKWHYNRKQKFCTKFCADEFQTKGWGTDKNGYKVIYRSDGKSRVWVMQHRQVMEQHLGRKLRPDETVHHKDGNRANNDLSNLELWSSRHGKGQRVDDKVDFCLSFLADYPDLVSQRGCAIHGRSVDLPRSNLWLL